MYNSHTKEESDAEGDADEDYEDRKKLEDGRVQCGLCERYFFEDRIKKHEKACKKNKKKRPVFDVKQMRATSSQLEVMSLTKSSPDLKSKKAANPKPMTAAPKENKQ
mmetsp:Transcript_1353/g.1229  ORF Transcript_1353/g.1229 Transcript_1353/m.1229 type:complete len:107 (+) Transcript_1353:579-899(+)|eukprot:CAMPEP_0114580230 /NCGR_PEP_ID=MMETSP0125-20121206/4562_1 /TAXON_ID=485358 ORGANISM="Aristerostoma sp., Strain ATCC 50986" /NCGR_SAMPLE_ID=MMETSP0125 /ASSEMBLY_ACC=CAM_ASM_000245 /LENGTH=106 /DNA_ID=CAMNT_0001771677 /DNA_START=495 /DNA_END=815 /DNA_ORIENTATION=-